MDTKKTRKVKLRNGPVIEVSQQIFNWRARIRKLEDKQDLEDAKAELKTLYNAPECPTIDEQASTKATPNWNLFK